MKSFKFFNEIYMIILSFGFLISFTWIPAAYGETYPSKDITLILGQKVGQMGDIGPRTIAPFWEKHLGCKLIIVNKPGAGGEIGYQAVAASEPDGYTIGNWIIGTPQGQQAARKTTFKNDDFDYIGTQMTDPHVLAVLSDDTRFKTLKEFIDFARKHPGELKTGFNVHSDDHVALERFSRLFNLKFKVVAQQGGTPARTSFLGKYLDFLMDNTLLFVGYIGPAKPIRILSVCWPERINWFDPNAPTIKELTGKDFANATYRGFVAPKGVPPDRLEKLRVTLKKAAEDPEYIKEAKKRGVTLGYYGAEETERLTYKIQNLANEFWKK